MKKENRREQSMNDSSTGELVPPASTIAVPADNQDSPEVVKKTGAERSKPATDLEPKTSTKNKYKSPKAKEMAKSVTDLESDTVSDLDADTMPTVEQALDLPVPKFDDGVEAASKYVTAVHASLKRGDERLKDLAVRIGTVLLAFRNSEHGDQGRWERFVETNFPFTARTARRYMSLVLESTSEQRAGKGLTEVLVEIGVVTRPGDIAKTRFFATLDKVEKQASAAIEVVQKVAEAFEAAVAPYSGRNRDIGAFIYEYANKIGDLMTQCQRAATLVANSVQTLATTAAPEGEVFHAEGVGDVRQHADWSEYPEGTTIDGKQPEDMSCCDREAVMASNGKSTGTCRECGIKVSN